MRFPRQLRDPDWAGGVEPEFVEAALVNCDGTNGSEIHAAASS